MYPTNNYCNTLVANQFNPDSFHMVQTVYMHLDSVKHLCKIIPNIQDLSQARYTIDMVYSHLGSIKEISSRLSELTNLEMNLDFLRDIAPRVDRFVQDTQEIKHKLDVFDCNFKEVLGLMETNTKHLEDLYVQYECGLSQLIEQYKAELCEVHQSNLNEMNCIYEEVSQIGNSVKSAMPLVQESLEEYDELKQHIRHLLASDRVTIALHTNHQEDKDSALKAIKASEKIGNDETINRERLSYKLKSDNVLNVIAENKERLMNQEECECHS